MTRLPIRLNHLIRHIASSILISFLIAGCGPDGLIPSEALHLYADQSSKEAVIQLANAYETENPGQSIVVDDAPTGEQLAQSLTTPGTAAIVLNSASSSTAVTVAYAPLIVLKNPLSPLSQLSTSQLASVLAGVPIEDQAGNVIPPPAEVIVASNWPTIAAGFDTLLGNNVGGNIVIVATEDQVATRVSSTPGAVGLVTTFLYENELPALALNGSDPDSASDNLDYGPVQPVVLIGQDMNDPELFAFFKWLSSAASAREIITRFWIALP
jgi:hypothetical protein